MIRLLIYMNKLQNEDKENHNIFTKNIFILKHAQRIEMYNFINREKLTFLLMYLIKC